jgi:hypothetical protein
MTQAASAPINDAYVPGVCNINREEIKKRQTIGYVSLAVSVAILALLLIAGSSRWFRLVIALPAIVMVSGFLQAKNHFCVGYAGAGQENASEGSTTATTITDDTAKTLDKKRSSTMNRQSFAAGVVIALLTLIIPVTH